MVYDRDALADLLRRANNTPCGTTCGPHSDQFDAVATHALDEIESDVSNYTAEAVNEALAGEDL